MATSTNPDTTVPLRDLGSQTAQNVEDIDTTVLPSVTDQPAHSSGPSSPTLPPQPDEVLDTSAPKKKKKKKQKKSAKAKEAASKAAEPSEQEPRQPVLCISRNKHWRYISSYHGPWLQLPIELLESLLVLNMQPPPLGSPADAHGTPQLTYPNPPPQTKPRERVPHNIGAQPSLPDSSGNALSIVPPGTTPIPTAKPGKPVPPPIDPGVFSSVTSIRRLIDEAAELCVRATSGLSAVALGSMRSGGAGGVNNGAWSLAQGFGINPSGDAGGGGRNVTMSAMRVHRLRALAVQKLAQAYKADEIASSVMVMQGGSVFDDVAERVLKNDPTDADARYVHFFHEKIPSRQLAESTTTQVLDELIAAQPQRLEFYRTRGIVHCFRDEYAQAIKDFTHALKEARAVRKAKFSHRSNAALPETRTKSKRKKSSAAKTNGQAPPSGTSALMGDGNDGQEVEPAPVHPSVLPDAPEPLEPQLLFLRGAAFLQHAVFLIEDAILKLEGIRKGPYSDGTELRLCYLEHGKYGGVEIGHPDGPLGKEDGAKVTAYRQVLADPAFRSQIDGLIRKSIRDHERFLSHFDTLEGAELVCDEDIAKQTEDAFILSESIRPGNHANVTTPVMPPPVFTTYHPLFVESKFSMLICQLMLAEFTTILPAFIRTAALVNGLEGYPVFLPPRSMAQAEFVEVLERLAGGWKNGIQPHSLSSSSTSSSRALGKLAIEPAMLPPPSPSNSASSLCEPPGHHDTCAPSASTASSPSTVATATDAHDGSTSASTRPPSPGPSSNGNGNGTTASHGDLVASLDCLRILLAPVVARQRQRSERAAAEKAAGPNKKKPLPINIPLHGPRVEIVLAWLGAVHLVELDRVA